MTFLDNLIEKFFMKINFHFERLFGLTKYYPKKIYQRSIDKEGYFFEVSNIIEANRILYFDSEKVILNKLIFELKETDIFFDIGACIGLYSMHVSKRVKKIYAFEPDPEIKSHLEKNIMLNSITNIEILSCAIGEKPSKLMLSTSGVFGASPSLINNENQTSIPVNVESLDSLIENKKIPVPNIIKIDIEGGEIFALKGMSSLLKTSPPRLIFLELHPDLLIKAGYDQKSCVNILLDANYLIREKFSRDNQINIIFESKNNYDIN